MTPKPLKSKLLRETCGAAVAAHLPSAWAQLMAKDRAQQKELDRVWEGRKEHDHGTY